MSLNDRDVPMPNRDELNRSVLLLLLFTLLACLPNAMQDTTIDVGLGFVTAFAVMGLGLLEQLSTAAFAAVMVVGGLFIAFLCLGGWSIIRRFWVQNRKEKALHTSHYSVVSSLGGASERLRQNSAKAKNKEVWKSARFQSFELENDEDEGGEQQEHPDVIMPFAAANDHAARINSDKSKAYAAEQEQQDLAQQQVQEVQVQVQDLEQQDEQQDSPIPFPYAVGGISSGGMGGISPGGMGGMSQRRRMVVSSKSHADTIQDWTKEGDAQGQQQQWGQEQQGQEQQGQGQQGQGQDVEQPVVPSATSAPDPTQSQEAQSQRRRMVVSSKKGGF
ncbi:hypothetical protein B484DRAFT_459250 [Ochromonadaceae sp. CCMP2298]|nr:hypothetical protein B484DRAFT_459250 [Ochromonadaceae sp. CCMP2298]